MTDGRRLTCLCGEFRFILQVLCLTSGNYFCYCSNKLSIEKWNECTSAIRLLSRSVHGIAWNIQYNRANANFQNDKLIEFWFFDGWWWSWCIALALNKWFSPNFNYKTSISHVMTLCSQLNTLRTNLEFSCLIWNQPEKTYLQETPRRHEKVWKLNVFHSTVNLFENN